MVGQVLKQRSGLSSNWVRSIPEQWDKEWFRRFIINFLQSGDVRNAVAMGGVTITPNTGGISAPPTISLSGVFASIPADTVIGNTSATTAPPVAITQAQLTALIQLAAVGLSGAAPPLSGVATQFLNGVGAYSVPLYPTGSNPTAKVGSAPVNGTSGTFMRSDAAPPIDLTISATWSGNWLFSPTTGDAITIQNVSGSNALHIIGNAAGTSVIRLDTQATTGSQTATFTATNKPGTATTSPDKWVPVSLDGTVHYMPAWL